MQQVTRKILGVAVLGAAFAAAGTGVAFAGPIGSIPDNPGQAVHKGRAAAAALPGAVERAEEQVVQKRAAKVTGSAPVRRVLDAAPSV